MKIVVALLLAVCAALWGENQRLSHYAQDINSEQQQQAAVTADARTWYHESCEPVSQVSGTITCTPNPELEK